MLQLISNQMLEVLKYVRTTLQSSTLDSTTEQSGISVKNKVVKIDFSLMCTEPVLEV